jgi:predicted TIM-barrel fold metal-dependent hydrolase
VTENETSQSPEAPLNSTRSVEETANPDRERITEVLYVKISFTEGSKEYIKRRIRSIVGVRYVDEVKPDVVVMPEGRGPVE